MGCPYDFGTLWRNLPKNSDFKSRETLYPYLGWGDNKAMMTSSDWENTCAIRMSVCLIRCGMFFNDPPIGARIQNSCPDPRLRGKAVVLGFDRLAKVLKARWGAPVVYKNVGGRDLNNKKGVVAYFVLPAHRPGGSRYPGHIDLIRDAAPPWSMFWGVFSGDDTEYESGTGSYLGSRETWFWASNG